MVNPFNYVMANNGSLNPKKIFELFLKNPNKITIDIVDSFPILFDPNSPTILKRISISPEIQVSPLRSSRKKKTWYFVSNSS